MRKSALANIVGHRMAAILSGNFKMSSKCSPRGNVRTSGKAHAERRGRCQADRRVNKSSQQC